jgi:hypothetical protein
MVRHAILPVCPASLVIRPVRTMDMSALHTDCVAVLTATFLARGGIMRLSAGHALPQDYGQASTGGLAR